MQRIKDEFLDNIELEISLHEASVLEVGCGNGVRSQNIAMRCESLFGVDPNQESINEAKKLNIPNATFQVGSAESLNILDSQFDIVLFTLSLHHVPLDKMSLAIDNALLVVNLNGYIIFLEPTEEGSLFDAEILFNAEDGDERTQKKTAYQTMTKHTGIQLVKEFYDETIFKLESTNDFVTSMHPTKNFDQIEDFLKKHDFMLNAKRRTNIFQIVGRL